MRLDSCGIKKRALILVYLCSLCILLLALAAWSKMSNEQPICERRNCWRLPTSFLPSHTLLLAFCTFFQSSSTFDKRVQNWPNSSIHPDHKLRRELYLWHVSAPVHLVIMGGLEQIMRELLLQRKLEATAVPVTGHFGQRGCEMLSCRQHDEFLFQTLIKLDTPLPAVKRQYYNITITLELGCPTNWVLI